MQTRSVQPLRALLFDVFGTTVDWRSGVTLAAHEFLGRYGAPGADAGAFADAWRARYQPAMQAVRSGQRAFVRLDVLHRENLLAILPQFGIDPQHVPAPVLDELNLVWHRLDPWPDVIAGLTRLKARYIIAPLSNANVALALNMARRAGLPWDAILGAEVAGAYKPTPESYLRTVEMLALQPAEVSMVAAHNSDLAAAHRCGLQTAFVPRPREHGVGQVSDLRPEQPWDVIAGDFMELADRLGA
jgi:2-haloacid dehalogenase